MQHLDSKRAMWRQFLYIWAPLFLTQLSLVAGGFFAATTAGRHSTADLAGAAVGYNLWMPILVASIGLFTGLTPIVSHLLGADDKKNIPTILRQAVYLAIALGLLIISIGYWVAPLVLGGLGLEPTVYDIALRFLGWIGLGVVPTFVAITLRNAMDAHGYTRISLCVMLIGFTVNILLNYCFIDGNAFIPAMGGAGAGAAIAASNLVNCCLFLLLYYRMPPFSRYRLFSRPEPVNWKQWKEQLRIGIPIGGANFMEVSLFSIVGLLMASYGTRIIAAHQAATNFSNLLYTLPLSAGIAATILCGFELGAKRFDFALRYARIVQMFTVGLASVFFVLAVLNLSRVAGMYTKDPTMLPLISSFLPFALMFTFSDSLGVPIQGALRGYKDVRFVFITSLCCYWGIGLTTGISLARFTELGPYGYWIGFIVSLIASAIAYNTRLIRLDRRRRKAIAQ